MWKWQNTEMHQLFSHNVCQKITSRPSYWCHLSLYENFAHILVLCNSRVKVSFQFNFWKYCTNSLKRQYYFDTSCASVTFLYTLRSMKKVPNLQQITLYSGQVFIDFMERFRLFANKTCNHFPLWKPVNCRKAFCLLVSLCCLYWHHWFCPIPALIPYK